jgi:hypothetical protein
MAKETKAGMMARLDREEAELQRHHEAFLETIPKRMAEIQVLAESLCVGYRLALTEVGPELIFNDEGHGFIEQTMHYGSQEWEVTLIHDKLLSIRREIDAKTERLVLAKEVVGKMTTEEKAVIAEFSYLLTQKPLYRAGVNTQSY